MSKGSMMNSIFKLLENPEIRDAWNDIMDVLLVEKLKEDYILCLDFDDIETASSILVVMRFFMVYDDFKQFLNEIKDAGYIVAREF